MIQTVERRILHIIDDIDNINPTQMAIEPIATNPITITSPLVDYYGGGFGVKTDTDVVYRFSKFDDVQYVKGIYSTRSDDAIILGGSYKNIHYNSSNGVYAEETINIGKLAGLVDTVIPDCRTIFIGERSGYSAAHTVDDVMIGVYSGLESNSFDVTNTYDGDNVYIGKYSGYQCKGHASVYVGSLAGWGGISDYSTSVGYAAGRDAASHSSVNIGFSAGDSSTGEGSVYIGAFAGDGVDDDTICNVAIGRNSLGGATAKGATAIGRSAGSGSNSQYSFFGGFYAGLDSVGNYNISIGYEAGRALTGAGGNNICIGRGAGQNSSLENNIIIGRDAGQNSSGTGNILIGQGAKISSTINGIPYGVNDALLITNSRNNYLIGGNFQTGRVNIYKTLNMTPTTQPIPAYKGDIIYNSASNIPQYYDGGAWVDMGGATGVTFIGLTDVYNTFEDNTYNGIDYRLAVVNPNAGGVGVPGISFPQSIYVDEYNVWVRNAYFEYRDALNISLMALEVRSLSEDAVGDSFIHAYTNGTDIGGNLHLEVDYTTYFDSYNTQSLDTTTGTHSWGYLGGVSRLETMKLVNFYNDEYGFVAPTLTPVGIDNAVDEILVTKGWVTTKIPVSYPSLPNYINVSNGTGGWANSGVTLTEVGFDTILTYPTTNSIIRSNKNIRIQFNYDNTTSTPFDAFTIENGNVELFKLWGNGASQYGVALLPLCTNALINANGAKSIATKEYSDFKYSTASISSIDYLVGDFRRVDLSTTQTINNIINITVGQAVIIYVNKTASGGVLNFNGGSSTVNVILASTPVGKYSFVISKVSDTIGSMYLVTKPAEVLNLV